MRRMVLHRQSPSALKGHPQSRRGLTLFEVLMSLVIFVGAMSAVGQLIHNGSRGALQSRLHLEATIHCEAKLSEVIAGAIPLQSVTDQAFPDDASWSWSLVVAPASLPNLTSITVKVERTASNSMGRVKYSLTRLLRDPAVYAAAAAEEAAASSAAASTSSSSSTESN